MTEKEYIKKLEEENMELVQNLNAIAEKLKDTKDTIKALTKQINSDDIRTDIEKNLDETIEKLNSWDKYKDNLTRQNIKLDSSTLKDWKNKPKIVELDSLSVMMDKEEHRYLHHQTKTMEPLEYNQQFGIGTYGSMRDK